LELNTGNGRPLCFFWFFTSTPKLFRRNRLSIVCREYNILDKFYMGTSLVVRGLNAVLSHTHTHTHLLKPAGSRSFPRKSVASHTVFFTFIIRVKSRVSRDPPKIDSGDPPVVGERVTVRETPSRKPQRCLYWRRELWIGSTRRSGSKEPVRDRIAVYFDPEGSRSSRTVYDSGFGRLGSRVHDTMYTRLPRSEHGVSGNSARVDF